MNAPRRHVLAALVAFGLLTGACQAQPDEPAADDGLHVVASTDILGELVADLVGTDGTVEVLLQSGADPHDLALSVAQVAGLREADLVVVNGLGLEAGIEDALAQAESDGVRVEELGPLLDPLEAGEDEDEHEESGEHDHGVEDPHVWLDPIRMAEGVEFLAAWLAEVDDTVADDEWLTRGAALADEIRQVHEGIVRDLARVPDACRILVTNHDAFRYFAARYGFEVVGTVIPGTSTQASASAGDLADLARVIEERGVPAIFAETTESTRLAEALAEDLDRPVQIVQLHAGALGPVGSGAEDYLGMMTTNASLIADALAGCRA